ncbi:MAG TPA: SAM-dependent chlorinase/fluorinase [Candidatus Acidoferrales bacterium]|nr:SAM-dependent chlorinase/fluorinase [Candidatus Acidoferrales bacterium]
MAPRVITLTTDFGTDDAFVGIMKGVILGINPAARLVDLSHNVPPQDVLAGALILRSAVRYFPAGTVHLAVVDPGVGSARRALLIQTEDAFYVGPDNGLLSLAVGGKTVREIIELTNGDFFLKPTSHTFHGRDIFAPVAAHLSLGKAAREFGRPVDRFINIDWPEPRRQKDALEGEIIYIDRFGNLTTNLSASDLRALGAGEPLFSLKGHTIRGLDRHYAAAAGKGLCALINSWDLVEIARFQESARAFTGAARGDKVSVRLTPL